MSYMTQYKEQSVEIPTYEKLNNQLKEGLQIVDDIILKNYITKLREFEVIPLSQIDIESNISENVRIFKITEMVYEKDEFATYKFASVFNTLANIKCTIFIIIDSNGEKIDFYMGVRCKDSTRSTNSIKEILENSMNGQFPGIRTKNYYQEEIEELIDKIKDTSSVSIVSSVANNRADNTNDNKTFIQGLEKLALSMQGECYTAIVMADSTSREELLEIRRNYENIYTQLSPFATSQISYSTNNTFNLSQSFTEGKSTGTSYNRNESSSYSNSRSSNISNTESQSKQGALGTIVKGISTAATMVGTIAAPFTGGTSMLIGGGLNLVAATMQKTDTKGSSKGTSYSNSSSSTTGKSFGESNSVNTGNTDTKGISSGNGKNISMTVQEKNIISTLERIDTQLERLKEFESLGMWECAAYFLSDTSYGAERAATTYKALIRGENSGVEVSAINSWNEYDGNNSRLIKDYVTNFISPVFRYRTRAKIIEITPNALVSGNELAVHMGLPRKSVSGFPVIEHADFGKEVVSYNEDSVTNNINLGCIFNMGKDCVNRVNLNRHSLSMHTFITGSTGSGKSNTVYELLDQLSNVGIKFLIIEPAKGEYKNVFGRRRDVRVLGTNSNYTEILKINPFKFPSKIHILEHIDRLIEIFNVCWPMYAAMPAVLKEAVLQAYEMCGWDLIKSENRYIEDLFPTFKDLQIELINVIENSAYSQELKSNYIGALVTRVKSLTNGINGEIFSSTEIDNNILFDNNVIVDLSRVGSSETKSFIMGILIMRLNEHRMALTEGMNIPLKHVTVLEEAHNILRKNAGDSGSEGGNVAGKSVEMLSNAIAEMRTYGEGFIIVDQSPSAVDISAIRNTNTKIIMRLPDESDRRLAGKSAALDDEQLDEITKLPKGVAVVYQNDWIEPVLCKVNKFDGKESLYKYDGKVSEIYDEHKKFLAELMKLLLLGRCVDKVEVDTKFINMFIGRAKISSKNKVFITLLVKEYEKTGKLSIWSTEEFKILSKLVTEVLDYKILVSNLIKTVESFELLKIEICSLIDRDTDNLNKDMKLAICHCLIKDYSGDNEERLKIYQEFRNVLV